MARSPSARTSTRSAAWPDTGRFADDLPALLEVLGETGRDLGVGVLLLIDELQEATPTEMTALNTAVPDWVRRTARCRSS